MSRPSTEHYDLSETEKRDLIKLIEQGKPLPEKYRFMLFADKREVELVWNGKSPRGLHRHPALPDARTHRRAAEGNRPGSGLALRHLRPPDQGLDQQTHLGRQQAHPLLPQVRRAPPPDRGRRRPQAHLHRPALRRRRGLLHGHRDRRRNLPQGTQPPRANRLPRYLGPWRGFVHLDDL